ncbi:MAG: hypothetical protein E7666_01430 [Ruminococcaceae bacterium]|nr:hypothetical protein [Oscillospiraceae bacterium]
MSEFRSYLLYRLRHALLPTAVMSVLAILYTQPVIRDLAYHEFQSSETGLYVFSIVLGILCTVIPILEFAGLKNRRNLDTMYSFPISRSTIAAAHYLSGLIQIIFVFSISFFAALPIWAFSTISFQMEWFWGYYFFSLLIAAVMYSIFCFFFACANSVLDGVIFCGLSVFLLYFVDSWGYRLQEMITKKPDDTAFFKHSWGFIYSPINNLTVIMDDLIFANFYTNDFVSLPEIYLRQWYGFVLWGILGIAALIGFFIVMQKKRTEQIGDLSTSWFGYRTMIPICGYTLISFSDNQAFLFIMICMLIGYFIYRRGFRLRKSDVIVLLSSVIFLI